MVLQKVGEFLTSISVNGTEVESNKQSSDTNYDINATVSDWVISYNKTFDYVPYEDPVPLFSVGTRMDMTADPEKSVAEREINAIYIDWDLDITTSTGSLFLIDGTGSGTITTNDPADYQWSGNSAYSSGLYVAAEAGTAEDVSISGTISADTSSDIDVDSVNKS